MVTEFANYNHHKNTNFINSFLLLCIHDGNCYLSSTSGHAFLPLLSSIHSPLHERHKEINFVAILSLSPLS